MGTKRENRLRQLFELNFKAHQTLFKESVQRGADEKEGSSASDLYKFALKQFNRDKSPHNRIKFFYQGDWVSSLLHSGYIEKETDTPIKVTRMLPIVDEKLVRKALCEEFVSNILDREKKTKDKVEKEDYTPKTGNDNYIDHKSEVIITVGGHRILADIPIDLSTFYRNLMGDGHHLFDTISQDLDNLVKKHGRVIRPQSMNDLLSND